MFDSLKEKLDFKKGNSPPGELEAPPPPYNSASEKTSAPPPTTSGPVEYQNPPNHNLNAHSQPQSQPQGQSYGLRFPQSFGIYHAPGSISDLVIAQHNGDPNPIYLITTHSGLSSQPSVVLHTAPHESAPPLATADFHSISSTTDLTLFIPDPSAPQSTPMHAQGMIAASYVFDCFVPSTNSMETFEWKRSSGDEVGSLQGSSYGKKCVRMSTGEVVAAFAKPGMSWDKKGKMAFLAQDRGSLGEMFEVCAVVGVAAIMEKERRRKKNARHNRGVAGVNGMGSM